MSWADDHISGNTYQTTQANIGAGASQVYIDKKFLRRTVNKASLMKYGQKRPIPQGEGKTIEFYRWNPLPMTLSSLVLSPGVNPNATQATGQDLRATLVEYGAFVQPERLLTDIHKDPKLHTLSELLGDQAGDMLEIKSKQAFFSSASYPMRADADATKIFSGTLDAGATSTTFVDAALTSNTNYGDANDDLNQSVIIILTGTGRGQSRPVIDYVASSGTGTVAPAWDITPAAGDTYTVVSLDDLGTGDKLTTTNIRAAVQQLKNMKATPMANGLYRGILCPDTEAGLMADSTWQNTMQYSDGRGRDGNFTGKIGVWGGVEWEWDNLPFRCPITTIGTAGATNGLGDGGGNYTPTGAVYATPIFGMEAFGITTLAGNDVMKPGIIIKKPGSSDTSNPLDRYWTVGWYIPFVAKGLQPFFGTAIYSGA